MVGMFGETKLRVILFYNAEMFGGKMRYLFLILVASLFFVPFTLADLTPQEWQVMVTHAKQIDKERFEICVKNVIKFSSKDEMTIGNYGIGKGGNGFQFQSVSFPFSITEKAEQICSQEIILEAREMNSQEFAKLESICVVCQAKALQDEQG